MTTKCHSADSSSTTLLDSLGNKTLAFETIDRQLFLEPSLL